MRLPPASDEEQVRDVAADVFALDRRNRGKVRRAHGAHALHPLEVAVEPVSQQQRKVRHEGGKLDMGLVNQIPPARLVESLQRALAGLAPALRGDDRDSIVAGHELLALLDPVGHELPLSRFGTQFGHKLHALAFRKRAGAHELVAGLRFRRLLVGDHPTSRLQDGTGQGELGVEDVPNHLLAIPGCPAIRKIAHRHGAHIEALRHVVLQLGHAID